MSNEVVGRSFQSIKSSNQDTVGVVLQCETFSIFPVIRWKQYLNYDFTATFIWCRVSRVHFPFSFSFFLLTFQYVCVRFVCLYVQPTLNLNPVTNFMNIQFES